MFGRILCTIGLHRWVFEDIPQYQPRTDGVEVPWGVTTVGRCKREGCKDYPDWRFINLDRRRPW